MEGGGDGETFERPRRIRSTLTSHGSESREEIYKWVSSLDHEKRAFLLEQSHSVLQAHGEIQDEHRDQANRLLRAYAGGIGLLLVGLGFIESVVKRIQLPEVQNPSVYNVRVIFLAGLLLCALLGGFLVFRAFLRFAGIIDIVSQILTPERIENDSLVGSLVSNLPFYPGEASAEAGDPFANHAREGIRREMSAKDLTDIARFPEKSEERVLTDRLVRAERNESVIDYNMRQLSRVYEIISKSLVDVLMGGLLLAGALVILSNM